MGLPASTTEQFAREYPARFARAMGNDWLADLLEGRPRQPLLSEMILERLKGGETMGDETTEKRETTTREETTSGSGQETGSGGEVQEVEQDRSMVTVEETRTVEQPSD